jgi:cyclopropane fatty-acyl-phospholipid synthase-like methyltransferase
MSSTTIIQNVQSPTRWKIFWENQNTPLHNFNNKKWYELYAKEFNLLLAAVEYNGGSVLETGCGNGALFDYLNINKNDYIGTDISEKMLSIFKVAHPQTELICTDCCLYTVDRKFSLIYSNSVVQNLNSKQLDLYIQNSLPMLAEDGIMLIGNILWDKSRADFYSHRYAPGVLSLKISKGNISMYLRNIAKKVIGKDYLGYWYSPNNFLKYQNENIQAYIFGSLFYPYRFSVALKKIS